MKKHFQKNNHGITLIALVVTIIALLILAGVSLNLVAGSNGLINKAIVAREEHTKGQEKEAIQLAYTSALISKETWGEEVTLDDLQEELERGGTKADVVEDDDGKIHVTIEEMKNVYIVDPETGKVDYIGDVKDDIQLQEGDMEITPSTADWTNQDVIVSINIKEGIDLTNHIIEYKKSGDANWNVYDGAITFSQNDTIVARVRNTLTAQSKLTASLTVDNIDKLDPIAFTPTVTNKSSSITISASATDAEATTENGKSGIKEYRFSKDNGSTWSTWQTSGTYEFTGLTQNKTYNLKVEAKDNAGNVTSASKDIMTLTVATPTASDLTYTTSWNGTNATVTFTTTSGLTIQVSKDGTNWETGNSIIVPSGMQVYAKYSDGTNTGDKYAAVQPLWTGTVSYNINGGTGNVPANQSAQHTTTVTVNFETLPTRTGYTFAGWNTKSDGTGTNYTSSGTKTFTMGTSNITLYAKWTINSYTMTFNAMGGSCSTASKTFDYNTSTTSLPTPTKTGYRFVGWFRNTSDNFNSVYYYQTYSDLYNAFGTNAASLKNHWFDYGLKEGRRCSAQNVNASSERPYTYTDTSNITVYAIWEVNQYTITYNANGGSVSPTSTKANYVASMTMPTPTKTGYTFNGWYTATSGGTKRTYTTMPAYNETVYAQWTDIRATTVISATNYGDSVNYSANSITDWKIFLNDGTYIYLIASDYVPNSGLNKASAVGTSGAYNVYWNKAGSSYTTTERDAFVSWLKNTSYWTKYAEGMSGATATGGPTREQFWASYNGKYGTGYSSDDQNLGGHTGYNNTLYFPRKSILDSCWGYWLATPRVNNPNAYDVGNVLYNGYVSIRPYATAVCGVRPLVRLPSGITATKGNDGKWMFSK